MKLLTGLGGLLLFTIIWLVLDFRLGRKKHLSSVVKTESPIHHGDFDIFTHGKELFADYFNELRAAKHRIYVLFYIVKDDEFGQEFLSILMDKAREGIEVRLLLDRLGSWKMKNSRVKMLREAGVAVGLSDPIRFPFLFYTSQVRNHRKISIIDGKIAYLGGFNIGKEYVDGDPKLSPWRDYHLKITGESVNYLQSEFLLDWKRNNKRGLEANLFLKKANVPNREFPLKGAANVELGAELNAGTESVEFGGELITGTESVEFGGELNTGIETAPSSASPGLPKLSHEAVRHQFIPTEAHQLEGLFLNLIQLAENTITIGTPYFIPSTRILEELLKAVQRGICVTVIVPTVADHPLVKEASFRYLRPLIREGGLVYQYQKGFYHAKTIVIDDKLCDIGTANFDKRSLYLNKEINCYVYDPEFIASLKEILTKDIHDSKPLTLAALDAPSLNRSVKEAVARTISYFL
ncbi:phosphatidylserine/phosphatidylglycerophosphate/cardiolipin synthase family protein [Neobacillus niacini]|uniref:phospholipase D-like domain-containing protein n=1 Tax=Neobacillus niacini TaxID=86668 RepID=UPI0021CB7A43|nr:phospholipase D-like domain-containing protein [Neobacillus niacini]MCM3764069.1 phospholipase D-like domain-containing protein [Neobacillus niacini]